MNKKLIRKMLTAAGGPIYEEDWSDKLEPYAAGVGLAGDVVGLGAAATGVGIPVGTAIAGFANIPNLIIDGYQTARDTWRSFNDNGNSLGSAAWNGGEFILDATGLKALQYINKATKAGVASEKYLTSTEKALDSKPWKRVGTGHGRVRARQSANHKRKYNSRRNKALEESNIELAKRGVRPALGLYYQQKLSDEMAKRGYGVAVNDAIKSVNRTVRLNLGTISGVSGGTNIYHLLPKRKSGGLIRKMQTASGGPIHYSRTMTADNMSRAANYVGGYVLRGLGALGKIFTAPLTGGPLGPATVVLPKTKELLDAERKLKETQEELIGRASTWLSPLNYGAALMIGNGLNAKKGEEEVASWSPAWLAAARLGELYVGSKGVKAAKATPKTVVNAAAKAGVKPAKAAVVAREIKLGIKLNTKNGRIEVTENYFNSPDKWYRITETPEKYGIMELGKNVTTHDASQTYGTINGWRSSMLRAPITKSSEGFIKRPHKIELNIRRKNGQAHGNTSQAAKGKLWGGTTSGSNLFPEGVIEGQAPSMINYGIDRTNFVITPWELIPNGGRVGFHTGEMPMSNLGWFQRTNKGTYTYEPIISEKRITYHPILLLEPSTSLKFFERKLAKNNIVGASLDYSMKDTKGINYLKLFFAQLKINGKEYTLEGLKDAANVLQGLPEYVQSYLNLNTVERAVRAMRKNGYSEREILLYVDKVNEEMNKVKVGMYSDLEYNAAGALGFGGFYNNDLNFISVNKDAYLTKPSFTPYYIMKHEGRHLIDYNTSMTNDVINILKKAYDKDFLEIPKHEDAGSLKDYLYMDRERVTTNRDAREVLLSNLEKHPGEFLNLIKFVQTSFGKNKNMVDFLNELILYAKPEDIINAVENSNGYGKRYINYLKKNNKLTTTKIEQLRQAMIHVPSYVFPIVGGYTLYNLFNQPLQQLQYQKQGGKMNILEFLKNGSGIHIKKKNRGKFTSYCGGKVTDECIRKAKASGNPTLVKRATFALNARRWKHKEGGIIKALEGTKTNFFLKAGNWINNNKDLVSSITNTGLGIFNNIKLNKAIDAQIEANEKQMKANKQQAFMDNYTKALGMLSDRSDIVNRNKAWLIANSLNYSNDELENENFLLQQSKVGMLDYLGGLSTDILNNLSNKKSSSNNPPSDSYFGNYVKTLFKNPGTFNSDGSFNTSLGAYKFENGKYLKVNTNPLSNLKFNI